MTGRSASPRRRQLPFRSSNSDTTDPAGTTLFRRAHVWIIVLLVLGTVMPAFAQSQDDFVAAFAGKWQVYDRGMAEGKPPYQHDKTSARTENQQGVAPDGCRAPLA